MVTRLLPGLKISLAEQASFSRILALAFAVLPIFWAAPQFTLTPFWGLVSSGGSTWLVLPKYESESVDLILFVLLVPGLLGLVQLTQVWTSLLPRGEKLRSWPALLLAWALPFEIGIACARGALSDAFATFEATPISFSGSALVTFVALGAFRMARSGKVGREQTAPANPSDTRRQRSALLVDALLSASYLIFSYLLSSFLELLDPLEPADTLGYFWRACSVTALVTLSFVFLREAVRAWSSQGGRTTTCGLQYSFLDPVLLWGSLLLACKSRYKEAASLLGSGCFIWLQVLSDFVETKPWAFLIYVVLLIVLVRASCEKKGPSDRFRVGALALGAAALPWLLLLAAARPLIAAGKVDALFHRWQCSLGGAEADKRIVPMWDLYDGQQEQPTNGGADFLVFPEKPSWLLWPIHGSAVVTYCLARLEEKSLYVMLPPGRCEWRRVTVVSLLGTSWKTYVERARLSSAREEVQPFSRVPGVEKRQLDVLALKPYSLVRHALIEVVGFTSEKQPRLLVQAPLPSGRFRKLLLRLE